MCDAACFAALFDGVDLASAERLVQAAFQGGVQGGYLGSLEAAERYAAPLAEKLDSVSAQIDGVAGLQRGTGAAVDGIADTLGGIAGAGSVAAVAGHQIRRPGRR